MKLLIITAALAALEPVAHAMGSDIDESLVAWNTDGSAALFRQTTSRDGDTSSTYWVVAPKRTAVVAAVSRTQRDNGKDVEEVPLAECKTLAAKLAANLQALSFNGVTVDAAACAQPRRSLVRTSAAVAREVERSWVALPQGRSPMPRETTSWQVVHEVDPTYVPVLPDDSCATSPVRTIDVANLSGKLILVVTSNRCGNPIKARVSALIPGTGTTSGYVAAP